MVSVWADFHGMPARWSEPITRIVWALPGVATVTRAWLREAFLGAMMAAAGRTKLDGGDPSFDERGRVRSSIATDAQGLALGRETGDRVAQRAHIGIVRRDGYGWMDERARNFGAFDRCD